MLNLLKIRYLRTKLEQKFSLWRSCKNAECMSGKLIESGGAEVFLCPHCHQSSHSAEDDLLNLSLAKATRSVVNYCPGCRTPMFHSGEGCDVMNCPGCSKVFRMRPPTPEEEALDQILKASKDAAAVHSDEITQFLNKKHPRKKP